MQAREQLSRMLSLLYLRFKDHPEGRRWERTCENQLRHSDHDDVAGSHGTPQVAARCYYSVRRLKKCALASDTGILRCSLRIPGNVAHYANMDVKTKLLAGTIRQLRARRERVVRLIAKIHAKIHGHIDDYDLERY